MNLDGLISKYLDGDLSISEDVELRELIAGDQDARQKFDDSVDIHIALKRDAATIEPPEDLVRETEDKVLLAIMNQTPVIPLVPVPIGRKMWRKAGMLAAAISMFMVSSVIEIDEFAFNNSIPVAQLERAIGATPLYIAEAADGAVAEDGDEVENNGNGSSLINKIENIKISTPVTSDNILNIAGMARNNEDTYMNKAIAAEEIYQDDKASEVRYTMLTPIKFSGNVHDNGLPNMWQTEAPIRDVRPISQIKHHWLELVNIETTTFISTDLMMEGIDEEMNGRVYNISQSLTFCLSDFSNWGMEIGQLEYSYYEKQEPAPTHMVYEVGKYSSVDGGATPNNNKGEEILIDDYRNRTIFWGTLFYEMNLINTDIFSVKARLGAGATNDGPLGMGKLYARYRMFPWCSVLVGTQGRAFLSEFPKLSHSNKSLKSTVSLIYGIELDF